MNGRNLKPLFCIKEQLKRQVIEKSSVLEGGPGQPLHVLLPYLTHIILFYHHLITVWGESRNPLRVPPSRTRSRPKRAEVGKLTEHKTNINNHASNLIILTIQDPSHASIELTL